MDKDGRRANIEKAKEREGLSHNVAERDTDESVRFPWVERTEINSSGRIVIYYEKDPSRVVRTFRDRRTREVIAVDTIDVLK